MITEEKKKVLRYFAEGQKLYKLMNFAEALKLFEMALAVDPKDGPSKVYCDRCRLYLTDPPPEDWDGVFVMKTK